MAALHQKIADDLRGRILDGELAPQAKLPTEQELTQRYGVSRNTVRAALAALSNQGLIITVPGRAGGSFVRDRLMLTYYASRENSPGSEHTVEFEMLIRAQDAEPHEVFSLSVIEATVDIAERLRIAERSVVVLRRLERSANNEPVSVQNSYYPEDLARDTSIMKPRSVTEGIGQELRRMGYDQVGYRDELVAEMPSLEEVAALHLSPGVPVLRHWRIAYAADRPIRATLTLFAADRNRLVYESGDTSAGGDDLRGDLLGESEVA